MLSPSQYLTERAGLYLDLTHTGTVCKAGYNMPFVVMQHTESRACAPHIQFQSDIKLWSMKTYDENTNELTKAMLATVAKKLQQDRALLLHAVYCLDHFGQAWDNKELYLELRDGSIKFFAWWLMHQLITFNHT